MLIHSTRLGKIEVDDTKIVSFPQGLPGFEENKNYALVQTNPELPFAYLQSTENNELSFIIIDPFLFFPEYEIELSDELIKELAILSEEDVSVFSIVSVGDDLKNATVNLMAPVIINKKSRKGKQDIIHDTPYSMKHRLFPEPAQER